MNYSKYNRYTAILDSADLNPELISRFTKVPGSKSKGYIRLETGNNKGVLSCSAENLRHYEKSDYLYKLILLGKKNERVIFANGGTLAVNRHGHGEVVYQFNPDNADGNHNGLHEFSSVVIAGISTTNTEEDMYPILIGLLPTLKGNEQEPAFIDVSAFFKGEPEKAEETEKAPVVRAASVAKETSAMTDKRDNRDISQNYSYNSYYNDFIKTSCIHMQKVSSIYEVIYPFGNDTKGIRWYKVLNVMSIPFVNTTYQFASSDYFRATKLIEGFVYPSCQDLATRYRHFLFGIKEIYDKDLKESFTQKYYFGIPGMYCREEQPDGGKSGFRYWQPLPGGNHDKNTYGYWIAAIDAQTGSIEEIPVSETE